MAQQRIDLDRAWWLAQLRGALNEDLVDVRYQLEGESVDFVVVYARGQKQVAVERFLTVLRSSPDCPPFDIYLNEESEPLVKPLGEYRSVSAEPVAR